MVIVLNEKAEPPPYALVDPSKPASPNPPSLPPRPSREDQPSPSHTAAGNFLHVKRTTDSIKGSWIIDPTLPAASGVGDATGFGLPGDSSSRPGSSKTPSLPNLRMETQSGEIDVSVKWTGGDKATPLPRAMAEIINYDGPIRIVTVSRPSMLPLHMVVTSFKRGDARIRLPENFRGVIAVRAAPNYQGVYSSAVSPLLTLSAMVNERVSYTRETAQTVKSKTKGKGKVQQDLTPEDLGGTTFEYLIGLDLEPQDLNRAPIEKGVGALDYLQVDVRQGRAIIYDSQDRADWEGTALVFGGTRASLDEHSFKPPLITINKDEPKWLRKLGKLSAGIESGNPKDGPEHKVGELVHGIAGWLYTSCQQSVNTFINMKQASSSSLNVPSTNKPRSSSTSNVPRPSTADSATHSPSHSPSSSVSAQHLSSAPTSPWTEVSSMGSTSHLQNPGSPTVASHLPTPSTPTPNTGPPHHPPLPASNSLPPESRLMLRPASPGTNTFRRRSYTPDGTSSPLQPYPEPLSDPYSAQSQIRGRGIEEWAPTHHLSRSAESVVPHVPRLTSHNRHVTEPPPRHPNAQPSSPGRRPHHSRTHPQPHEGSPRYAHVTEWLRNGNELQNMLIPMFTGGGGVRDADLPRALPPAPGHSSPSRERNLPRHPPPTPPRHPPSQESRHHHHMPRYQRSGDHCFPHNGPGWNAPCYPNISSSSFGHQSRSKLPPPRPVPVPGAELTTWTSASSIASRTQTLPSPVRSKKLTKKDRRGKSTPDLRDEARKIEREAALQAGSSKKLSRRK